MDKIEDDDNIFGPPSTERSKTVSKSATPVLDSFGRDLTQYAIEDKLDPIVGRQKEIERVSQILSRRKKNNPLLIGEPGVGKSAIAEGLALRIIQKKVSRILYNKRVVTLDLASIVAGTKYRGQFEERLKKIIEEAKKKTTSIANSYKERVEVETISFEKLIHRNNQKLDAEIKEIENRYDLILAKYRVLHGMGLLLQHFDMNQHASQR